MTVALDLGFLYAGVTTMPGDDVQPGTSGKLAGILTILLNTDWVNIVAALWHLAQRILIARAHEGMYEVLEYESTLELLDPKGQKAILRKREKVRFLQDNIIAYQDKAWGDGEIFADYKCSPGVAVDRYREGQVYRVLISLRGARQRGDVEEFRVERTIENGYLSKLGYFQTDIDHVTQNLVLHFVFPRSRIPRRIVLMERQINHTTILGEEHTVILPDGRCQVSWDCRKPRLFEAYIVQWEW